MDRTNIALCVLAVSLILHSMIAILVLAMEGILGTQAWIDFSYHSPWYGPLLFLALAANALLLLAPLIFFRGRHDFSENHPEFVTAGLVLIYVTYFLPLFFDFTPSFLTAFLLGFGILLLIWTPADKISRSLLIVGALALPFYVGFIILCFPVLATFRSQRKIELERRDQYLEESEDWLERLKTKS